MVVEPDYNLSINYLLSILELSFNWSCL